MSSMIDISRLLLQSHKTIHGHHRTTHTVFDCKHHIQRDLYKLSDEAKICAVERNDVWPVIGAAGQELGRDVWHTAGNCNGCVKSRMRGKTEVAEKFCQDLGASALRHRFLDKIAFVGGTEGVAPEDLDVRGLRDEMRLMRDDYAEEPVAVFECRESPGTGRVVGEFCEMHEEVWGF